MSTFIKFLYQILHRTSLRISFASIFTKYFSTIHRTKILFQNHRRFWIFRSISFIFFVRFHSFFSLDFIHFFTFKNKLRHFEYRVFSKIALFKLKHVKNALFEFSFNNLNSFLSRYFSIAIYDLYKCVCQFWQIFWQIFHFFNIFSKFLFYFIISSHFFSFVNLLFTIFDLILKIDNFDFDVDFDINEFNFFRRCICIAFRFHIHRFFIARISS